MIKNRQLLAMQRQLITKVLRNRHGGFHLEVLWGVDDCLDGMRVFSCMLIMESFHFQLLFVAFLDKPPEEATRNPMFNPTKLSMTSAGAVAFAFFDSIPSIKKKRVFEQWVVRAEDTNPNSQTSHRPKTKTASTGDQSCWSS